VQRLFNANDASLPAYQEALFTDSGPLSAYSEVLSASTGLLFANNVSSIAYNETVIALRGPARPVSDGAAALFPACLATAETGSAIHAWRDTFNGRLTVSSAADSLISSPEAALDWALK